MSQILPAALLQTEERKVQKKMVAFASSIIPGGLQKLEEWTELPTQTKSSCYRYFLHGLIETGERCAIGKGLQLFFEIKQILDPDDLIFSLSLCLPLLSPRRRFALFKECSASTAQLLQFLPYFSSFSAEEQKSVKEAVKTALAGGFMEQAEPLIQWLGNVDLPFLEELSCNHPRLQQIKTDFRLKERIGQKEWEEAAALLLSSPGQNNDLAAQVFFRVLDNVQLALALYNAYALPTLPLAEALFQNNEALLAADLLIKTKEPASFLPQLILKLIKKEMPKALELYEAFPYIPLSDLLQALCQRDEEMYAKKFLLNIERVTDAEWQMIVESFYAKENYEAASVALREAHGSAFKKHQNLTKVFIENGNFRLAEFHLSFWNGPEWAVYFHQVMEKKVASAPPAAWDKLIKEEVLKDQATGMRWYGVFEKLLKEKNGKAALALYPKIRHFFPKPMKQQCFRELVEALSPEVPLELFSLFSQNDFFSLPLPRLIEVIRISTPTHPQIEQLLEWLITLTRKTKDLPQTVPGWVAVLSRMNTQPTEKADTLLLNWFQLIDFGKETENESEEHLLKTEFWQLALSPSPPLSQRQLITVALKNVIRIVLKETKPPKNQIPLLWFAHSLQKTFDQCLLDPGIEVQESYLAGEKELIESIGRIIDHEAFQKMARKRLNHFDRISRGVHHITIDPEVRHQLNPFEYWSQKLSQGLLFGAAGLAAGIIGVLAGANFKK